MESNIEEMTYSESARGVMISVRRVVQELKAHGFTGEMGVQALAEFASEVDAMPEDASGNVDKDADWIDAGELFDWLGY